MRTVRKPTEPGAVKKGEGPATTDAARYIAAMSASRIATFLAIVFSILGTTHYYLWTRLIRDTALPTTAAQVLTVVLVLLALSIPGYLVLARALHVELPGLGWVAFIWMGSFFLLFVCVLAGDLAAGLGGLAYRLALGLPEDPERRLFLARLAAGGASVASFAAGAMAVRAAIGRVKVRTVEVTLGKLPRSLDGFRIAQISDVHIGDTVGADFMRGVVDEINRLSPDLVAVVGDLVDGSVQELSAAVASLGELKSKHGTYFVTGNHEYYSGADEWIAHLRSLGLHVLRNERVSLGQGTESFDLAGTDDHRAASFPGHGEDLDKALRDRDPSRALVLLAHQPKTFREAAKRGVDLQLSGHTHGGQIWPFGFFVKMEQGFLAGLDRLGDAQLYTSRGTGYWGPPMRLGAPAEITQVVLRSAAPA